MSGGELTQTVAADQRCFRMRRHLHQMDVEVQKTWMVHRPGQIAKCGLKHVAGLDRAGAGRGFAGTQVPHAPGCPVKDRFHKDGAQIEVVGMRLMGAAHGIGKGIVPGALVVNRIAPRIARRQRLDQRTFRRGGPVSQCDGRTGRVMSARERRSLAGGILQFPRVVVIWPDRIGETPMRHGAIRVHLQRLLKAGSGFLMVVAKAPVEAAVKPALGIRRGGCHRSRVGTEVIRIVHVASLSLVKSACRPTRLGFVDHTLGWLNKGLMITTLVPLACQLKPFTAGQLLAENFLPIG